MVGYGRLGHWTTRKNKISDTQSLIFQKALCHFGACKKELVGAPYADWSQWCTRLLAKPTPTSHRPAPPRPPGSASWFGAMALLATLQVRSKRPEDVAEIGRASGSRTIPHSFNVSVLVAFMESRMELWGILTPNGLLAAAILRTYAVTF